MKKFTALVALALLAIAGTGYAVTCAQDNVPGATLLVPYFRVGGAGTILPNDIPETSGTDTLCAVTNVSAGDIIIHVTVWNKYSKPVLDFNVPMTGYDVVFWSMRDILNGKLVVNPVFQHFYTLTDGTIIDPCSQNYFSNMTPTTTPYLGTVSPFIRFSALDSIDRLRSISVYPTPAFTGSFRTQVWTSLDESYDISTWLSRGSTGGGVIDDDNPICSSSWANGTVSGDFSGYVTVDLVNYCTQRFPDDDVFFLNDAIATVGWGPYPGSNILMGDVFYKDQKPGDTAANMGNVSGDPMVHLEFDSRLDWNYSKTFYRRYNFGSADGYGAQLSYPTYAFPGDGREPLGNEYGFRYLQTAAPSALKTWIIVWRSDRFGYDGGGGYSYTDATNSKNLCSWWAYRRCLVDVNCAPSSASRGFTESTHDITVNLWDNDENVVNVTGGPSGGPTGGKQYIYLEAQRLVVSPNGQVVPSSFLGGWVDLILRGFSSYNESFVGVQHSGLGNAMSVGHSATLMSGQFVCNPAPLLSFSGNTAITIPTNTVDNLKAVQTN
jgi:hypothetical protein